MAERIKDADDRILESMFEAAPIADAGFSAAVVRRIRRRLWLRRLAVPVAALGGGAIAVKPLTSFVTVVASLTPMIPPQLIDSVTSMIPQLSTVILGGILLAVCLIGVRALED
ncbi:MAG: hypothetical protein ACR2RD_08760 [Woeseiaceae bacterium]